MVLVSLMLTLVRGSLVLTLMLPVVLALVLALVSGVHSQLVRSVTELAVISLRAAAGPTIGKMRADDRLVLGVELEVILRQCPKLQLAVSKLAARTKLAPAVLLVVFAERGLPLWR